MLTFASLLIAGKAIMATISQALYDHSIAGKRQTTQ